MDEQALEAQGVAALGARRKNAQDFRGRQEENGHRRSDGTSAPTAALWCAPAVVHVCSWELDW